MTIIEFTATPLAPFTGFVDATDGGTSPPQSKTGVDELRGDGAPTAKSALLRSVSTQPLPRRRSDVVLLGAGAAPPSSKQFAVVPYPMKSTTFVVGHAPLRAAVAETSATLPAVPDIGIEPAASGVGRSTPQG